MNIKPLDQKTIVMPTTLANAWIDALRSGNYMQGSGELETLCLSVCNAEHNTAAYCCLGVLQHIADGQVERYDDNGRAYGYPSDNWLENHNIEYNNYVNRQEDDRISFRDPIIGITNDNFASPTAASSVNDYWKCSFSEIADLLEHCIEKI